MWPRSQRGEWQGGAQSRLEEETHVSVPHAAPRAGPAVPPCSSASPLPHSEESLSPFASLGAFKALGRDESCWTADVLQGLEAFCRLWAEAIWQPCSG